MTFRLSIKTTYYLSLWTLFVGIFATPVCLANSAMPPENGNWSAEVSWLDMRLGDDALSNIQYANALSGDITIHNIDSLTVPGSYHSGFRIGLDRLYPCSWYGINANYSYLSGTDDSSYMLNASSEGAILGNSLKLSVLLNSAFGSSLRSDVRSASASVKPQFQSADLNIHRDFILNDWLSLRALAGAQFVYLEEKLNANYNNVGTPNAPNVEFQDNIAFKNHFWGLGPELGLKGKATIFKGLSLNASMTGALLGGVANSQYQEYFDFINVPGVPHEFNQEHNNVARVIPALDGQINLRYDQTFSQTVSGYLALGYEIARYFKMVDDTVLFDNNQPNDTVSYLAPDYSPRYEDFQLSGLVLTLGIKF